MSVWQLRSAHPPRSNGKFLPIGTSATYFRPRWMRTARSSRQTKMGETRDYTDELGYLGKRSSSDRASLADTVARSRFDTAGNETSPEFHHGRRQLLCSWNGVLRRPVPADRWGSHPDARLGLSQIRCRAGYSFSVPRVVFPAGRSPRPVRAEHVDGARERIGAERHPHDGRQAVDLFAEVELLGRLHLHELHRRERDGFSDCLGIVEVVLLPLGVGTHILHRH
jgi:hypothetical protein